MSTKVIVIVAVVAVGLAAYLMFFKKKVPATTQAPPVYTTKQGAQNTLTGAVNDGLKNIAVAGVQVGVNAATNWLSDVSWG